MSKRSSLMLAALAVVLCVVSYALTRRETTVVLRLAPAIRFPIKDIRLIEIYHGEDLHASFQTEDGREWLVRSGLIGIEDDAADRVAIGDLMQLLFRLRTYPADVGMEKAGLETLFDATQLVVQTEDGEQDSVYLGAVSEDGADRYFVIGSDPHTVHKVDHNLTRVVDRPILHLRSWDLFDLRLDPPERITLRHGAHKVVLERAPAGWALTAPVRWPAEGLAVQQFLETCAGLRAVEFANPSIAPDKAGITDGSPSLSLSVDGTTQTVRFGSQIPGTNRVYAMRDGRPTLYLVESPLADLAAAPSTDLFRQSRLALAPPDALAALEIEHPQEGTLRLQQQGGRWVAEGARTFPADAQHVAELAETLANLHVVDLLRQTEHVTAQEALNQTPVQIRGIDAGGRRLFALKVGAVSRTGVVFGQLEGRDQILRLDPFQAERLRMPFLHLRSRVLTSIAPGEYNTIEIRHGETHLVIRHTGGTRFFLQAPTEKILSQRKIFNIISFLQRLTRLQALAFVEDDPVDLSKFDLDPPMLRVLLRNVSDTGNEEVVLDLAVGRADEELTGSGERIRFHYARLAGESTVFTISADLVSRLLAPYGQGD